MSGSADGINRMDIAEFRNLGYLQELNRRFLHPCGLALEVVTHDDDSATFGGVWDYRTDPEGITYGPGVIDPTKIAAVDGELARHEDARRLMLGSVIQQPTDRLTETPKDGAA